MSHCLPRATTKTVKQVAALGVTGERPWLAASRVRTAKLKGVLVLETCEICTSPENLEAHHHDYSRALDITCLCGKCHIAVHWAIKHPPAGDSGDELDYCAATM